MLQHTKKTGNGSKPVPELYIGGELHSPPTAPVELAARKLSPEAKKRPKTARSKAGLQPAAEPLDTLEVKGCSLEYLKEQRKQCRQVAKVLTAKSKELPIQESALFKAGINIQRCSLLGVFRNLSESVNYKTGQALCRNRLCPNCQRMLAAKRKAHFLAWFQLNSEVLKQYRFYHLVLTLRHSAFDGVRTGVYTKEITSAFGKLRGGDGYRDNKTWWNKRVMGGTYSTEITNGRDGTPHIHIHCLLIARMALYNKQKDSEFQKEAVARWGAITKDSDNVFIEPVYTMQADALNPKKRVKVYAEKGAPDVQEAVSECIKYTLKADAESLSKYTPEFLQEVLVLKNRYYSRFGCLTKKSPLSAQFVELERLNTDFKDLEQLERDELRHLFNPETGEIHDKADTRLAVTWFRNMAVQEAPLELRDRFTAPAVQLVPVAGALQTVQVPGFAPRYTDRLSGPTYLADGFLVQDAQDAGPDELLAFQRGETPLGGDAYFTIKDPAKVVYFENDERVALARYVAGSMYTYYSPANDLENPQNSPE